MTKEYCRKHETYLKTKRGRQSEEGKKNAAERQRESKDAEPELVILSSEFSCSMEN